MMASIKWNIEEVLYTGEGHAIVAAKDCPGQNKYKLQRQDGFAVPMWIHAANSRARELFKAKNIAHRNADGEGEDMAVSEAMQPEAVTEKLRAASSQAKSRTQEAAILEKKQRSDWKYSCQRIQTTFGRAQYGGRTALAMFRFGGELKCFTISRLLRNKLAHSMHGNSEGFAVRVSNVTSAVGKAVAIMQLAQSGFTPFVRDKT